MTIFSQFYH